MTEPEKLKKYSANVDQTIDELTFYAKNLMEDIKNQEIPRDELKTKIAGLKILIGNKGVVESLCKLIAIQINLSKSIPPESEKQEQVYDESDARITYQYFIDRYESEELYRDRLCTNCGHKQHLWDHLVVNRVHKSFADYIEKQRLIQTG